jgi:hypothetical protein
MSCLAAALLPALGALLGGLRAYRRGYAPLRIWRGAAGGALIVSGIIAIGVLVLAIFLAVALASFN